MKVRREISSLGPADDVGETWALSSQHVACLNEHEDLLPLMSWRGAQRAFGEQAARSDWSERDELLRGQKGLSPPPPCAEMNVSQRMLEVGHSLSLINHDSVAEHTR